MGQLIIILAVLSVFILVVFRLFKKTEKFKFDNRSGGPVKSNPDKGIKQVK